MCGLRWHFSWTEARAEKKYNKKMERKHFGKVHRKAYQHTAWCCEAITLCGWAYLLRMRFVNVCYAKCKHKTSPIFAFPPFIVVVVFIVVIVNITEKYRKRFPHSIHLYALRCNFECMKAISWFRLVLHPQFHWKTFQAPSKLNRMKTPRSVTHPLPPPLSVSVCGWFSSKPIGNLDAHTICLCVMRWQNCFTCSGIAQEQPNRTTRNRK